MIKQIINDYEKEKGTLKKYLKYYLDFSIEPEKAKKAVNEGLYLCNLDYFSKTYFDIGEHQLESDLKNQAHILNNLFDAFYFILDDPDYKLEFYQRFLKATEKSNKADIIRKFFENRYYLKELSRYANYRNKEPSAVYVTGELTGLLKSHETAIDRISQLDFFKQLGESDNLSNIIKSTNDYAIKVKALKQELEQEPDPERLEMWMSRFKEIGWMTSGPSTIESFRRIISGADLYLTSPKGPFILWYLLYETRLAERQTVIYKSITSFYTEKLQITKRHNIGQVKDIIYFLSTLQPEYLGKPFFNIGLQDMDSNQPFKIEGQKISGSHLFTGLERKRFPLENPDKYRKRLIDAGLDRDRKATVFCLLISFNMRTQAKTDYLEITDIFLHECSKLLRCKLPEVWKTINKLSDHNIIKVVDNKIILVELSEDSEIYLKEGIDYDKAQSERGKKSAEKRRKKALHLCPKK